MEQFQKGEDEEGDRDGCFVPPQAQAADKGAHAQRRLHQAVDGDGGERFRRKQVRRAHGRTAHAVGIRDFRPQREDGQAVGDEVDPQQLGGGEEIEAVQRQGDDEDGQDLGEVGGEEEEDGLFDVGKDVPPLAHGGDDGGKIVVGDDHVGGVFGDVRPRDAHGDADIRAADTGRVVDAVARHGDDFARRLQPLHDQALVPRRDAREHARAADARVQFPFRKRVQLRARQHLPFGSGDAQAGSDGKRRLAVVARDHDGADARLRALFHRLARAGAGRIDHAAQTEEDELFFQHFPRKRAIGEGEHAQGAGGELTRLCQDRRPVRRRHRAHGAVIDAAAFFQKHFRAALGKAELPLPRRRRHRHHLPFR